MTTSQALKQQKWIPSQFWRPQVWTPSEGVGKVVLPLMTLVENPSLLLPTSHASRLSLACGDIGPIFATVFTWLCPRVSLCLKSPSVFSFKDISCWS